MVSPPRRANLGRPAPTVSERRVTSIGIIVGSYLSGVSEGATVFAIGVGAAVGLGTSGVWSVWEIERAEKRAERLQIEEAMLTDLGETRVARRQTLARRINAVASGIGPLVPFLLQELYFSMLEATVLGIAIGVTVLFVFGAYLGSISKQNWIIAGVRMALAGLVVAAVNVVLPG